jgi:hypothetical protein
MVNQITTKVLSPDVSKFPLKCSLYLANAYRLGLKCSKTIDEMQQITWLLNQFRTSF